MRRRNFIILAACAAASPIAAWAEQTGRVYRLAVAHPADAVEALRPAGAPPRLMGAFYAELRRRLYIEGQNLRIDAHSGGGAADLFPALVARVLATKPDVIVTFGSLDPLFKAATETFPIVAFAGDDVLTAGFVTSFAHPGGNITGIAVTPGAEIWGKRLALLLQAVPKARRIAFVAMRAAWESPSLAQATATLRNAAQSASATLLPVLIKAATETEYRRAFSALAPEKPDALMLGYGAEHYGFTTLLDELVTAARLPALFPDRSFADAGGMMSYGVDLSDLYRHAANDVAAIFAGANPGDIPFYQPTRYELVINLETAKTLGIAMPQLLLAQADEVIE